MSLASAYPDAFIVSFEGMQTEVSSDTCVRFEHLGSLFKRLHHEGVVKIVMAGAMSRPSLNPTDFDDGMAKIAPQLLAAMSGGDDGLLREIIKIFEDQGFQVVGAHSLLPELTAPEGVLCGPEISDEQKADIRRADSILGTLSPVDVGQAVVVEAGICLGVETIQGTDALLEFVSNTSDNLRRGSGILVKRPKVGQDLRVDMPTIGPATVQNAITAGLAGIVISPGSVLLVDRDAIVDMASKAGFFVVARRHT